MAEIKHIDTKYEGPVCMHCGKWLGITSHMTYEILYLEIPAYRTDNVEYYDNGVYKRSFTTGFRKGMALSRMSKYRMTKPEAHAYIEKQTKKWLKSCEESKEKFGKYA